MDDDLPIEDARPELPTDDYACAIDLLGRVIALQSDLITSERARPRANLNKIAELQAARANAMQTARHLRSTDQPALQAAIAEYALHWTTLNTRQRHVEPTRP